MEAAGRAVRAVARVVVVSGKAGTVQEVVVTSAAAAPTVARGVMARPSTPHPASANRIGFEQLEATQASGSS
jgi:hypothetical protein